MRLSKQAGFSLLELLAAIVILGILSIIGIVAITNIKANQEKKFNQTQYELFKETAKTYFSDHKSKLPTIPGSTNIVYLEDLIKENYLDSLLDYNKTSYQKDKSCVIIENIGTNSYYYDVRLYQAGVMDTEDYISGSEDDKNVVEVSWSNWKKGNSELTPINSMYYANSTVKLDVKISDEDGIKSYYYVIYKNGKYLLQSDYFTANDSKTISDIITLNDNDYEDGTYRVEFNVYDGSGHKYSEKSEKVMIDRVAPSCVTSKEPNVEWTNKKTTITGICTDDKGKTKGNSGCVSNTNNITYTNEVNKMVSPGIVSDKAGNKTICDSVSVKIDKTAPIVKLAVTSQNTYYNTTTANVTVNISDTNAIKYELSTSNYPTTTYNEMTYVGSNGDNVTSMNVHNSYDGSQRTIYVTVKDEAGNEATATTTYSVYKSCSKTTVTGTTYGNCSPTCGSGTRTQTQTTKDTYLGTACSSINTTVSCGALPSCCTGPTTTYSEWSSCSKECKRDGVAGTKTRTVTTTQCDGTSTQTTESESCNTFTCCSSVTLNSCSASCGVGVKKAYSDYDGERCPSKDKTCTDRNCSKSTCYVGNKLYPVNVHWPYNSGTVNNGNCPNDTEAYWFYCTNSSGKLWTNLKKNSYYSGHVQWACKSNNLENKVGKTVSINGKSYKVIDDSNDFWKSCSNSCYSSSCS